VLLHNLAYLFLLPVTGHGGRYQLVNYYVVWPVLLCAVAEVGSLAPKRSLRQLFEKSALALFLMVCAASTVFWARSWAVNVHHINSVHVRAGKWINQNLPEDAVVATFDIGALRYFGGRRVVDLGGLTDPVMVQRIYRKQEVAYLRLLGVTHMANVERWEPERNAFWDITRTYRERGVSFELTPLAQFGVRNVGSLVEVAWETIAVYRVVWLTS